MRRIKVVKVNDITLPINEGYEEAVNSALEELEESGNKIGDISYFVANNGALKGVVIEFEAITHGEEK